MGSVGNIDYVLAASVGYKPCDELDLQEELEFLREVIDNTCDVVGD